jgi:glycosyltransferase involved in cell wall biosynthesis
MMEQGKMPKVSVCVITYNQEKYIRLCLQSIVDQVTDFDFEVIVGDDCSTDGTRAIVQEFAERYPGVVKPIFQEKNIRGGVHNYLTTHKAAIGEYIAHVDGDDSCLPGKLQQQSDYLETHPDCTVVWHRVNFFNDEGGFSPGKDYDYSMFDAGIVTFEKALRLGCVATHSSTMYRKIARKNMDPEFDMIDLFYTWEYLSFGWGVILDDVLGEYRVHSSNAITGSSGCYIKSLYAHHARYFFRIHPERRRDIFLFALTNFLVDLKNRRKSAIQFLFLALRTFSLVSPKEVIAHLGEATKLRIPQLAIKR